ncbi:hypothetical protein [Amycolatopsis pithecellobii]|uniref:Uncharacterized protein n=1 Tax=Amycolatopsis pithecellobii TaxID=664692 RepID=A0A6N7Z4L3_9PSEU|nr:hypothetical protein [Amycolatopsis pithecellobii]MTD56349.1 hypothetical protein [Amycolatopsis pithecellobii]
MADCLSTVDELNGIPLLGPVIQPLSSTVDNTIAPVCDLVAPTPPPATTAPPTTAPTSPAPPGAPANPDPSTAAPVVAPFAAPPLRESSLPGSGAVFGSRLPDALPGGGALFPLTGTGVPGQAAEVAAPQPAAVVSVPQQPGSAAALPARRDDFSAPVLAAVLVLAIVSAVLVRRWFLGSPTA